MRYCRRACASRRLLQVDQRQRLLEERRRHLLAARIVRHHPPKLDHRLLERLARLVRLILVRVSPRHAVVRFAHPVLRVACELMVGEAPEELTEPGDREGVAALAVVEVRRLIDVLRLKRAGRGPNTRRCRCWRRRAWSGAARRAACRRRGRSGRRRSWSWRRTRPKLTIEGLHARVELIDAAAQRSDGRRQRFDAASERGQLAVGFGGVLAPATIRLGARAIGLGAHPLDGKLHRRQIRAELHQVLLGGGAGHLGGGRAAAQRNEKGEEDGEPSPRPELSRR